MRKPIAAQEYPIDLSDRPLEDSRPLGPFIGCGGQEQNLKEEPINRRLVFAIDVYAPDAEERQFTTSTDEEYVDNILQEELSTQHRRLNSQLEENEVGDIRVSIDVTNLTIQEVESLRQDVLQIEQRDDVLTIYNMKMVN